jgi:Carboxypeptidase regulatory-like domain/TonB dependent receptor
MPHECGGEGCPGTSSRVTWLVPLCSKNRLRVNAGVAAVIAVQFRGEFARLILAAALALPPALAVVLHAQSDGMLQGGVFDSTGAALLGATVTVRGRSTGFDRSVLTDLEGRFHVAAIPAGSYEVTASADGFRSEVIQELRFEVGRTLVRDFRLEVGNRSETVMVRAELPLVDRATTTVGHVVTAQTVQEIPLNGRQFTDLGLLVPGSVAPSQTGFSTTPLRGTGALAINTGGNREEAVGFLINGVTTNNLTFGSLMFQPPIASIHEFKVDNSTFSPEYGHVSGAIVSIVTRSGTDEYRGEAFEFFRDDALDARNFFEFNSPEPHPFRRNQFGGSLGGPLVRGRTFFFASYEALRQRQGLDMNSLVLSDEQRAAASDPVVRRLIELIPRANYFDADDTPRFVGSATAAVDNDRWTVDLSQNVGANDRVHAFYGSQSIWSIEPSWVGTSIPGFGLRARNRRSVLTLNHTHLFGPSLLNEARFGRSSLGSINKSGAELNPTDFGIRNGIDRPIGLPQLLVAGGLNFGGPANLPLGRNDASYVFTNTLSHVRGRHTVKAGGEYRHFINENFNEGVGSLNFPSLEAFLAGNANAFSITLGERRNHINQRAAALFFQDGFAVRPHLTLELGLRYEWHVTPTERDDQFVVFDAGRVWLSRVGVDVNEIYRQNNRNVEPRVGVAWDASRDGRTVVRAAYGRAVDEPSTTAVRDTAANPPFATPLAGAGSISLASALTTTGPAGLAPATVDPHFRNASLQSWNVNVQRQLGENFAGVVGYFGSRGSNLRVSRNLNQPIDGVRPFIALSADSPIRPNAPLGNITQVESTGFSRYDALWISARKRPSRGLQFDASYTLSKSLDTNSLNSSGFAVQDSYDIPNQYGLSDFNARHRFVLSVIYELPFTGNALLRGWQLATIVQSQSGNPVNLVTSDSTLNGTPNTVRPDLVRPIRIIGSVDQWFDTEAVAAVDRFGNLGRNVVIGPGFHNTDLSIIKKLQPTRRVAMQVRVDIFDLFNHPNFGAPGNIVGSPTFGKITRTRLSTGEGGSSRQIQLAAKIWF